MSTSSIDNLKDLINHKIGRSASNGGRKMSAYVDEIKPSETEQIVLFETPDNDFVSTSKAPYYKNTVQVVSRSTNKDMARVIIYNALEYINARRKTLTGVYFIPENTPIFLGKDENGGYIYAFNVSMKGAK